MADHLLVGLRLGAERNEASLAKGSADHRLVEFRLGAVRCEASLAKCAADPLLMELESCATLNAASFKSPWNVDLLQTNALE